MALNQIITSLRESAENYSVVSLKLLELKTQKIVINSVSWLVRGMFLIGFLFFFLFLVNIGLALWLGDLLGKSHYGFITLGSFYLLIGFLIHVFLMNPIRNFIGKKIIKKWKQISD